MAADHVFPGMTEQSQRALRFYGVALCGLLLLSAVACEPTLEVDDDGDGFSDDEETAAGSDPLDAQSTPGPEPAAGLLGLAALASLGALRRHVARTRRLGQAL